MSENEAEARFMTRILREEIGPNDRVWMYHGVLVVERAGFLTDCDPGDETDSASG